MEVHRCRFVEYQPAAINALDFTPHTFQKTRLAVGRANGNIEIWDPSHRYRLEKTIPGGKDLSVESLVWAHQSVIVDEDMDNSPEEIERELEQLLSQPPRLFSSGLNPYIVEWNTTSLTAKKSVDSNGGAVWCLAVNNTGTRLAAACEDGCIRLFDIADDRLEYIRSFEAQKGRILSVAWSPEDTFIVSGGSDSSLRTWNVATGRATQRMTVNKIKKEHTLVWSVVVLKNNTVVSGDSLGNLMFWNAENGSLMQCHKAHGADILSVVASSDGDQVFSAGVDRKLTSYRRLQPNQRKGSKSSTEGSWVNIGSRRYHWHDIRALAIDDRPTVNSIVSGGVDIELVACPAAEFPQLIQNRLPPFPHKDLISLSKSKKLILSTLFNSLSLWKLGKATPIDSSTSYRHALPQMLEPHQRVLDIQLKPDCNITSSALSENAKWIAVADTESVRLFRVSESETSDRLNVKKVRSFEVALNEYLQLNNIAAGAHHVLFTPESDKLVIVTVESWILVIDLVSWEEGCFEFLREFGHHRGLNSKESSLQDATVATVISLAVSADGQWLATADDDNRIHVFNLDSLMHHFKLPRSSIPHTALSFNDFRPNELCVSQATNEFYIYNVEQKQLTLWSKLHADQPDDKLLEQRDRIRGMTYNPAHKDKMILYGSTFLCQADLNVTSKTENKQQKRKHDQDKNEQKKTSDKVASETNIVHKYQQILYCGFIDHHSMVMIERPKFSVLENLPPSYYKAQFGT
ncbi:WD40-repeat-containing domain protein [Spinellus fusiger]|nr:WD40-repeat-containing domain protein [Spinellus fusiger]